MSVQGIGGRRNWKKESQHFGKVLEVIQGKYVIKPKRKPRAVETVKRAMEEKELEKKIILSLQLNGCYVYKTGGAGAYDYNTQFNKAGISDLIVMTKREVMFMEVKPESRRNMKDGGLTGKQPEFKALCEKYGVKYVIVYSISEAIEAAIDPNNYWKHNPSYEPKVVSNEQ